MSHCFSYFQGPGKSLPFKPVLVAFHFGNEPYTTLCYTTLHYVLLYYTIPYSAILYSTMLDYTILCYTALCYTVSYHALFLYYTLVYYIILYVRSNYTERLKCSSFWVMTCLLHGDYNLPPKKELHSILWVCPAETPQCIRAGLRSGIVGGQTSSTGRRWSS